MGCRMRYIIILLQKNNVFVCLFVSFAAKAQAGGAMACSPLS